MKEAHDLRWFLDRLPARELLQELDVKSLLQLVKARAVADGSVTPVPLSTADEAEIEARLEAAKAAAFRISQEGDAAVLTDEERAALALFVLVVSRPALFVRGDRAIGRSELWPEIDENSELIPKIARGVGRVESALGDRLGTAFIAGDRRALTNNHVVCALLGKPLSHWRFDRDGYAAACALTATQWQKHPPVLELRGEAESTASKKVKIVRVVAHHRDVDMAVLELDAMPEGCSRLSLATTEPTTLAGQRLFAVGYPVEDGARVTPNMILRRIFGGEPGLLGTKRFSPGTALRRHDSHTFLHDASTLSGSSGSCIVDFASMTVLGIHFAGSYFHGANHAIALWQHANDPVLTSAGVEFS